jgi:hypothetical protein
MSRTIRCMIPAIFFAMILCAQEAPLPPLPQILAPQDLVLSNDRGRCSASGLILGTPVARDFAGGHTITASRDDGLSLTEPYPRGRTLVMWTVTDAAGQTASIAQSITVNDEEPPAIKAPPDVEIDTDDDCFATNTNLSEPVITENCPDSVLKISAKDSEGREVQLSDEHPRYPAGILTLTWRLIDRSGREASDTQRVVVRSREPPSIAAPPNVSAETDRGKCTAFVSVGTPTASDKCSSYTISATRSDGKRRVDIPFPAGRTTIVWTIANASGVTASSIQEITVNDTEGPAIGELKTSVKEIGPPNGRMVGVKVSYSAEDACGGPVTTSLSVTSNEPQDDAPDWEVINAHYVDLRAKQSGTGERAYTISVTAVDAAGNESVKTAIVKVRSTGE